MTAIKTQGSKIERLDTTVSPNAYVEITGVSSRSGPGGQRNIIDVTTMDSTYIEKEVGLPDAGQVSFDLVYDPSLPIHQALRSDWSNGTKRTFRTTINASPEPSMIFQGFVTGFVENGNVNEVHRVSVTIEITGAPTFTNM